MNETETVWHVQVEDEGVKVWTLDQLDAAYKAGLVDDATYVCEDGSTEWLTLGALLGGDEDEAPAEEPARPVAVIVAAVAVTQAPVQTYSQPPPASLTPQSLAPQAFTPQSFAPQSFMPQSTAPMVSDLDDLDAPVAFRSKKRGWGIVGGIALVAGVVAIAGFKTGFIAAGAAPVEVAAAAAPPPAAPPPVTSPDPPAVNPAQAAAAAAQRLNDDQRKALLEADKAREAKTSAKHQARADAASRHHKSSHEKGPFQNGGDKYDPLNAKL